MLVAAGVVTWMLFWMRRQACSVKGDLQRAVDRVLTEGTAWGLAVLAFTAVIREGLETALFLVGQATAAADGSAGDAGALAVLAGALVGLGIAVAIGYGFYRGSHALDLRRFFRWTGVLLIFIAAGLLSHAVHEFVEIGWITVGTVAGLRHRRRAPARPGDRPLPAGDLRLHVLARMGDVRHLGRRTSSWCWRSTCGREAAPGGTAVRRDASRAHGGSAHSRRLSALTPAEAHSGESGPGTLP